MCVPRGRAVEHKFAAHTLYPFAHTGNTNVRRAIDRPVHVEAPAAVVYVQRQGAGTGLQVDGLAAAAGVAVSVAQRLLDDPVQG